MARVDAMSIVKRARKICLAALVTATVVNANDCSSVVFDRTDESIGVRTLVVEDGDHARSLVLSSASDKSMPCQLRWWLDHNPQGVVQCVDSTVSSQQQDGHSDDSVGPGRGCVNSKCRANASSIELGYVRTMLASAVFAPESHTMSAICIEMNCRSRIVRTKVPTPATLLEAAPSVKWVPRSTPKRVLVIGLGSSTMALWLRQWLPETSELHVAELVPSVAAAAPCFGLDPERDNQGAKLQIHVADGREFLRSRPDSDFDAILVDAFDHNASLPACMRTSEFFQLARSKLTPGGVLSLNLLEGKRDMPRAVLQSLASGFFAGSPSTLWVGDAPGAQGIQNIISVFAPSARGKVTLASKRSISSATSEAQVNQAHGWFTSSQWSPLPLSVFEDTKALNDVTECPSAAH